MTRKLAIGFGAIALWLVLPILGTTARAADKSTLTFEVYQDKAKEYRWRLKDGDMIVATAGQGYKAKDSCKKGIQSLQKDLQTGKGMFEFYQDNAKAFRWRFKATNGQVIATANKGYKDKAECEKNVEVIKKGAATAPVAEAGEVKKDK